jgi:hypothetical protein
VPTTARHKRAVRFAASAGASTVWTTLRAAGIIHLRDDGLEGRSQPERQTDDAGHLAYLLVGVAAYLTADQPDTYQYLQRKNWSTHRYQRVEPRALDEAVLVERLFRLVVSS